MREGIQPRGPVGEVGEVVEIEDGQIRVRFPNCDRWHGLASELLPEPVVDNLQVGSKVRVCALRPIYGWGKVAPGEIGEVVQLHWGVVMVRFPQEPKWQLGNLGGISRVMFENKADFCAAFLGDIVSFHPLRLS